jgi:ribonuclease Z
MDLYDWSDWPNFFPVSFTTLAEEEMSLVFECSEYRVLSSPVHHLIPTVGLRLEFLKVDKILAYSCDTQPVQSVVTLAAGADVLIHEAAGASRGHSSAAQAGEVAREAEVGALYLIHYPSENFDPLPLVDEAQQFFGGPVALAEDFMTLEF